MRQLYVHAGLHKTGTSSVQAFFHAHREVLRGHGLLYPHTGIVPAYPGHHNLAWELAGDRRFDSRRGTVSALFSEIRAFDGDVLISSEDFEGSLAQPSRWKALRELAQQSGFELKLIVFLREQASYIESLYLQNLVLGCGECFSNDLEECLKHGELRKRDWRFHFNYQNLIALLIKSLGSEHVIVRDYDPAGAMDAIDDLCEAVQVSPLTRSGLARSHINPRRTSLDYLTRFHHNRFPAQRVAQSLESLQAISQGIGKLAIVSPLRQQIRDRFAPGNQALSQEFNLQALTNLAAHPQKANDGLADMARVFSFQSSLLLRKWFGNGQADPDEQKHWAAWVHQHRDAPPG
jgi:hypothetical protein